MNIYPSILETDINVFQHQILYLSPLFPYLQIDIADKKLVPNKTIQVSQILELITNEQLNLRNIEVEFHLMVEDYERELKKLEQLSEYCSIKKVLIHLKAINQKLGGTLESSSDLWSLGIVLNPEDDVELNWDIIKQFTTVQIMTITPGVQGNPFLPKCLEKITQLREKNYTGNIILDGGINNETLPIILQNTHLPDSICPGSYFKEHAKENLRKLQDIILQRPPKS